MRAVSGDEPRRVARAYTRMHEHQTPRVVEDGREVALEAIPALLRRARRRKLLVEGGAGLALLLAGLLVLGLVASLAAGLLATESAPPPGWVRAILAVAVVAASAFAAWRFVLHPYRELARDGGIAAFLESRLPTAAGLASAVEFRAESSRLGGDESSRPYSAMLADAHCERLSRACAALDPAPAIDTWLFRRAALALSVAGALHLAVGLAASGPVGRGYHLLLRGPAALPGYQDATLAGVPELITGDVELIYHYPAYTGLEPRVVAGTSGDIRALKGTEVELATRADRDVAAAALVMDETVAPLVVEGQRELRGRLLVSEPGTYRFRFMDSRGGTVAEGPPHRITLEPDEYPQIEVGLPAHPGADEVEIREQERLALDFRARDDFGIEEIALVWRVGGGREQRQVIRRGGGRERLEGRWTWELTTSRLAPGDRVAWFLEALDNDTVSGPKKSTTRTMYLKVFSAAEHHRRLLAQVEALWERMIEGLADHLEAPFEPTAENLDEAAAAAQDKGGAMTELTDEMASTLEELREDSLSPASLVDALENIRSGLVTANRRFESALRLFEAQARVHRFPDRHHSARVRAGQERIVTDLENGILYLESLLDKQRMQDLIAMAEEIREHQRRLADLAERLRDNPDEETRAAISEEIARIKERIHELMARMSELARGIRDDYLNIEAMEQLSEQDDLLSTLDDIQRMLEEGDIDEALTRLMDMSNQIDSMLEEWRTQDDEFGGERYAELQREVMEFVDELQRVKRDQDNLLSEAEELRETYREELEARLQGRLEELAERLGELALEGHQSLLEIPDNVVERGLGRFDRDSLDSAAARLSEVAQLLGAGDFEEARRTSEQALRHAENLAASLSEQARYADRYRHLGEESQAEMGSAAQRAERARGNADRILGELDQLFPDPSDVFCENDQARMSEMGERQRSLQGRSRDLQRRMQGIGEQAPLFSPDMERNLLEAGQHMGQAGRHLDRSDARQASGQQRAAAERLQELQNQMQEASERGGGQGMPMPHAGRPRGGSGGGGFTQERVDIPDADQHEAPEQFRRELLEAMREGTPERYHDQVRRYYEELVR